MLVERCPAKARAISQAGSNVQVSKEHHDCVELYPQLVRWSGLMLDNIHVLVCYIPFWSLNDIEGIEHI